VKELAELKIFCKKIADMNLWTSVSVSACESEKTYLLCFT
jgi:hypothetical protein